MFDQWVSQKPVQSLALTKPFEKQWQQFVNIRYKTGCCGGIWLQQANLMTSMSGWYEHWMNTAPHCGQNWHLQAQVCPHRSIFELLLVTLNFTNHLYLCACGKQDYAINLKNCEILRVFNTVWNKGHTSDFTYQLKLTYYEKHCVISCVHSCLSWLWWSFLKVFDK